jgi:hypothetical protein
VEFVWAGNAYTELKKEKGHSEKWPERLIFIWWALLDLNQRPTDYESRCDKAVINQKVKKRKGFSAGCRPVRSKPNLVPNLPSEEAPILLCNSKKRKRDPQICTEREQNGSTESAAEGDYRAVG